jgi:hypothetical protein
VSDDAGQRRLLTGDRIGVALLWLLIVVSLCVIAYVAYSALQPAACTCGG